MTPDELSMKKAVLQHAIDIISTQFDDYIAENYLPFYRRQLHEVESQMTSQKRPSVLHRVMFGTGERKSAE